MQEPSSRFITKLLPLLLIITSLLAIAQFASMDDLRQLTAVGVYYDPHTLFFHNLGFFALYAVFNLALIAGYLWLFQQRYHYPRWLWVGIIFATILIIIQSYPITYDPIFYFTSAMAWLTKGINPFQELVAYMQHAAFPFLAIPIPHEYAYGPLWLLITAAFALIVNFNYFLFNNLLTLVVMGAILATIYVLRIIKPKIDTNLLLIFLLFNPVTLIYILPSGNQEPLIGLILIASIYFASKQRTFLSMLLAASASAIKYSALPLAGLIFLWHFRNQLTRKANLIKTIILSALPFLGLIAITLAIWGTSTNYLQGAREFLSAYQIQGLATASMISLLITTILNQPDWGLMIIASMHSLFLFILAFMYLRYVWQILVNRQPQLKELVEKLWLTALWLIFLTGANAKPWYLYIPLLFSALLSRSAQKLMVYLTVFSIIGNQYLNFILFGEFASKSITYQTTIALSSMFLELLPLVLLISYVRAMKPEDVISHLKQLLKRLLPILND